MSIAQIIDHANLKSFSSEKDIMKSCDEVIEYDFRSICILPGWISFVKYYLQNLNKNIKICSVIGFPLGNTFTQIKIKEAEEAIDYGVDELDIVINISQLKSNKIKCVEDEVNLLSSLCKDKQVGSKIIIESSVLDHEEKMKIIRIVDESGVDYIKTCTGFNGDCTIEDLLLIKNNVKKVKIKASGGIKDLSRFNDCIKVGADIIGTSNSIEIMNQWNKIKDLPQE
jgi:deoxyribose-phosphate aldolase